MLPKKIKRKSSYKHSVLCSSGTCPPSIARLHLARTAPRRAPVRLRARMRCPMSYAYERAALPPKPCLRTLKEPKVINFDLVMIIALELSSNSRNDYLLCGVARRYGVELS